MVDTEFFTHLAFAPGSQATHALQAEDIADTINYILHAGANCVVDEINLSPPSKVIDFKK
jgi:NADP-dependent 3-hydroxy acid dehydrogenase YdfG